MVIRRQTTKNHDISVPREKIIDDYTMLETTIDELDGGSMYSVQIQSNTKTPINLIVSTVKTTQTLNQSKLCLVANQT